MASYALTASGCIVVTLQKLQDHPGELSGLADKNVSKLVNMTAGEYVHYVSDNRKAYAIDLSNVKAKAYPALQKYLHDDCDVVIGKEIAVAVPARKYPQVVDLARKRITFVEFRKAAWSYARFCYFVQEPVFVGDAEIPFLLLPKQDTRWAQTTDRVAPKLSPQPITQFMLPPVLPELHVVLAKSIGKAIGEEVGTRIAEALDRLCNKFEGFSREAALAASMLQEPGT